MEKLKSFVAESYEEMKHKVTWPKYGELQRSSVLVLVASLIFALIIGVMDLGFENALKWIYDAFKN